VVASAGTAMTESHLRELKRFTGDIRLCFDADRAGIAATERMIPVAQKVEVNLKIITIEGAKDPDELVQKDLSAWTTAIDSAVYAPDWLIERYKNEVDISSAQGKRVFTDVLLTTIRRLRDPIEQEHYLKQIAKITETSLEAVQSKLNSTPASEQPRQKKPKVQPKALERADVEYQRLQDHLLAMVLVQPRLRELIKDCHPEFFTLGAARTVLKFLQAHPDFKVEGELDVQALHHLVLMPGRAGPLAEMVQSLQDYVKILLLQFEELYADLPANDLDELAKKLKQRLVNRYVKMQNLKLTKAIEDADNDELRLELMKKAKKLNELIK
jgi:DNA primase